MQGKGVVVTGAGHGIGRALATRLAAEGARVVVNDLDEAATKEVATAIGGIAAPGDAASEEGVAALVGTAREQLGGIDIWFANAGIDRGRGLDAPEQDWAASLEVNVLAHVRAARLLVPEWIDDGGGRFVVTASAAGLLTMLGSPSYSVSKHAAVAFAEWLSATYRHRGVVVQAICPQGVRTRMYEEAGPLQEILSRDSALTPEDVAQSVWEALQDDRFLVLPHPEVGGYYAGPRHGHRPLAGRHEPAAAAPRRAGGCDVRAWQVSELGEPAAVLRLVDVADPVPGPGQLAVRVLASPANFPDVLMCRGAYQVKPELPFVPGVELCGEVVALGAGVDGFAVGDRVVGAGALPHGGFAELALMNAATTFPAPAALDDAQASSFYIGYQTGWFGLHRRAGLREGETLLVHAAAGGVGSAAIQLGKAAGATVIGVVGGPEKAKVARELGADVVVDRHDEDFVAVVKAETGGRGADVVYDPVGGDTYRRSTKCVAFEGRILVVGFAGGEIQSAALNHALVKNYSIVGLHWGLYTARDAAAVAECHRDLTALAASGAVRPLVSERLPLEDVAAGVQRLADGVTVGRVVYEAAAT